MPASSCPDQWGAYLGASARFCVFFDGYPPSCCLAFRWGGAVGASRWRVKKAVWRLRGAEPAALLPVRLKGQTAGRGVNLPVTSGTWTRDGGGILIRRAAYRRLAGVIWESL